MKKLKPLDYLNILGGVIAGGGLAGLVTNYKNMASAKTEIECEKAVKNIKVLKVLSGVALAAMGGGMALSAKNFDKFTEEDYKKMKEDLEREEESIEEEMDKIEEIEIDDSDIEVE